MNFRGWSSFLSVLRVCSTMYNWTNCFLSVGQWSVSAVLCRPLGTLAGGAPRKFNLLISVMVRPNFQFHEDPSMQPGSFWGGALFWQALMSGHDGLPNYPDFLSFTWILLLLFGFWREFVLGVNVDGFREHDLACQLLPAVASLMEE